jgi:hypothetical protein
VTDRLILHPSCRLVDIFLSSAKNNGGVDVWFVLLEKPELNKEVI